MAEGHPSDAFLWPIDETCKWLCRDGQTWTDDVVALESRLRQQSIDGETLLTYGYAFSKFQLMIDLGITTARMKVHLSQEIDRLRNESKEFRHWYKAFRAESRLSDSSPNSYISSNKKGMDEKVSQLPMVSSKSDDDPSGSFLPTTPVRSLRVPFEKMPRSTPTSTAEDLRQTIDQSSLALSSQPSARQTSSSKKQRRVAPVELEATGERTLQSLK